MSVQGSSRVKKRWRWFDLRSLRFLIGVAVVWTLLTSIFYMVPTRINAGNGLKVEGYCVKDRDKPGEPCKPGHIPWDVAFGNSLYFSIATETTVGYGDLTPQGFSRYVACCEAILGLIIAGFMISRLTNGPSGKIRALVSQMEGYWIEFCLVEEDQRECVIISLIIIKLLDNKLSYDGINYSEYGEERRDFTGESQPISTIDAERVRFTYNNLRGDDRVFKEGKTHLFFSKNPPPKWWIPDSRNNSQSTLDLRVQKWLKIGRGDFMFAEGTAIDKGHQYPIPMFAVRAESDGWEFKSWHGQLAEQKRQALARNSYIKYKDQIASFKSKIDRKTGEVQ